MDEGDVRRWFGEYLDTFAACGRGETDPAALLGYYGVPLVVTTDDGVAALNSDEQVMAMAQQQVDGMLATRYDHTEILEAEVTALNATSALYRAALSRQRSDGSEINRLTVTYLVTDGPFGRRLSAFAVQGSLPTA